MTHLLLNKTPEQWAKIDAEKVSRDCSSTHVMFLIADAKTDIAALVDQLEQYHDRFGPLDDEPDNPYKHAETPFSDNH
jgi:hypothetical protein